MISEACLICLAPNTTINTILRLICGGHPARRITGFTVIIGPVSLFVCLNFGIVDA